MFNNFSFRVNCQLWSPYSPFLIQKISPFSLHLTWAQECFVGIILQSAGEKSETLPSANSLCRTIMINNQII